MHQRIKLIFRLIPSPIDQDPFTQLAQCDGHDPPGLIDELVPCLAAVIDEIVVGFEDTIGEPVAGMNYQWFLTGLILR